MDLIAKPFGKLLLLIYNWCGNYGIAIFLFALILKLIMLPFQMKSKKGMMRMNSLQPQVKALEKRHEGNPRKYQEEVSKLYKEEKCNPMSGCIWSLIPFPILIALYSAIRRPLTVMMGLAEDLITDGGAIYQKLAELGYEFSAKADAYGELKYSQFISNNFDAFSGISEKLVQINYKFLGLNLGDKPVVNFWAQENPGYWALMLLIPIIAAFLSWATAKLTQALNPQTQQSGAGSQAANSMKSMNLMMPLMTLYFCFIMPAALGVYWIYSSVLSVIQEAILNAYYGKKLAAENEERMARFKAKEEEYERKRKEYEELKKESGSIENKNTSKKKLQAQKKAETDEVKAAAAREERAQRRAMLGIEEKEEIPESQVGNRRYARGRAYVADRYSHPETAEEKTLLAAQASEDDEAEEENTASCEDAAEENTKATAEEAATEAETDEEEAL
ncbi:MAG: YidC/Oxa1 family membrane protein insertase [Oscillospiraceae bacterium]|nr:YidC/Oxa1 family membrane protein insertase [Oscillospiraceae bacterium]